MKNIKHPVLKICGFILMGFLTLVIIISFGMPDVLTRINRDSTTAAIVNGDQITRMDYVRTIDSLFGEQKAELTPQLRQMVLDRLIYRKLQVQFADKEGVTISDKKVTDAIRTAFTMEGAFNEMAYKSYLAKRNFNSQSFFSMFREDVLSFEFVKMMKYGIGASPDELAFHAGLSGSKFQVRYAFLSKEEFKKRTGTVITASDQEIDAEMATNKDELKDPTTDRERFKSRIIDKKTDLAMKSIVSSIEDAASKKESFEKAVAILGVKPSISAVFKAGEQIKEDGKDGKPLAQLTDSEIFKNDFAGLATGTTSRAVVTRDGVYIFTPLKKEFMVTPLDDKAKVESEKEVIRNKEQELQAASFTPFIEKSKVERYMKIQDDQQQSDQ